MSKSAMIFAIVAMGTGKAMSQVGTVTFSAGRAAVGKHKQPL